MAKQTQQSPVDQLAAEILANIQRPVTATSESPIVDYVADAAGGLMNASTRIAAALRAAGVTAAAHYRLERGDQIDRAEVALAARAKAVAERMVARRQ